ncbi:hypothetical protein B0H14DRAFT_3852367 [Mycena olivaceomarginata]|nr:hypothetical protein B0H14DRAFT_3852367 [Mycena olivaceomarginata]
MDPNAGDQDPPDSEALVKVDGLWFMTDTVVIRVKNKIFRVSRGILAAGSIVCNNMIVFPQPNSGETETMDGSPVACLHDSAEDVEAFLHAIYDSSYFLPAPAPNHLSAVVGILRLSHKYGCQYLNCRALEHLHVDGWYSMAYDEHGLEHLNNGIPEFCPTHSLRSFGTARISAPSDLMDELKITVDNLEYSGMCSDCRELAKIQMHEAASAFWDELPSIFGLPPWGELHAMKRATMGEDED